jgi:hypothetical protein
MVCSPGIDHHSRLNSLPSLYKERASPDDGGR